MVSFHDFGFVQPNSGSAIKEGPPGEPPNMPLSPGSAARGHTRSNSVPAVLTKVLGRRDSKTESRESSPTPPDGAAEAKKDETGKANGGEPPSNEKEGAEASSGV